MKRVQSMTRGELRGESQFITRRLAASYQAGTDGLSYEQAEAQSMWQIEQERRRDDIYDELARIKRGDVVIHSLVVWPEAGSGKLAVLEIAPQRLDGIILSPQELLERGRALRNGRPNISVTVVYCPTESGEDFYAMVAGGSQ